MNIATKGFFLLLPAFLALLYYGHDYNSYRTGSIPIDLADLHSSTINQNIVKNKKQSLSENTKPEIYEPAPFTINGDSLPANYSGLDFNKYFSFFEDKIRYIESINLTKNEFETSKEFEQRLAHAKSLVKPISTSDLSAFQMQSFPTHYDADKQKYIFGANYYGCGVTENASYFEEKNDWIVCDIVELFNHQDSYTGSNVFGVYKDIKRTFKKKLGLAIRKNSNVKQVFRFSGFEYYYHDELYIAIEKARTLKHSQVAVLFVGHVLDSEIVNGRSYRHKPTIDEPEDEMNITVAIPFQLTTIYYYVVDTGEILGKKDFVSNDKPSHKASKKIKK
ncbi:hypothetical protein JWZ98_09600 [Methylomonas sp. EFPC1]|uniref:hypothetical protein n=1 Tax=Methylomonas sp. EFPC1 TaxID=2812647 RepID=UPI001967DB44|nr:hypothetical protein [Methylomonas sp. EFPC1]QSB03154.1 hypothetical protein JWZ98_09600 [Methylomonas sp. EFPC1]